MSRIALDYASIKDADYRDLRRLVRDGDEHFSLFAYIGAIQAADWDLAHRFCDAVLDVLRVDGKTGHSKEVKEWTTRRHDVNVASW